MSSDDELYQAFLLGDVAALDTLVLRHRERLIAYLRSLLRWRKSRGSQKAISAPISTRRHGI